MTSATSNNGLQDFIAVSRYSRYRPDLGRREVWPESVARVRDMHLEFFKHIPALHDEIRFAFKLVEERKILPSMRSIQFGGDAILKKHGRMFNCSFSHANRIRFFGEAFYMLLCGTGVGFSVQKHHVEELPPIAAVWDTSRVHVIEDTIEGWAEAVCDLMWSALAGINVKFDYTKIRPAGAPLVTAGGKAPGPEPLKQAIDKIKHLLAQAAGRQLRPVEVYDIVMHMSQAVLSGGVRRSATICLFSADDEEMLNAKTGKWFETHPQRAFSNNSAILDRATATKEEFLELFKAQKEFGEPGFYFTANKEYGANPCVEIGLNPTIEIGGKKQTGWQMCNLSTINGAAAKTQGEFMELCRYATLIGTLQAAYTDIEYLGPVTKAINDREALLGVSICGIMDNPALLLDPAVLCAGAHHCKDMNRIYAQQIGINRAARITCVKPEGTASLLLGVASGIHPHHARQYFRRVQCNRLDPVYQHFRASNPQACVPSVYDQNGTTDVVTFAVTAGEESLVRRQVSALQLLDAVKLVQRWWVRIGTAEDIFSPGLEHNVSNTINVGPDAWDDVAEFIWANRGDFTGIALLQEMGDKAYAQAPREEVSTDEDYAWFAHLRESYVQVDYTKMAEGTDNTVLKQESACAGGACELS